MSTLNPHPKLMVIGDSLAQGCRPLSVSGMHCSQSCSARIAARQKWPFLIPNDPRPVLFDLEREIRQLNLVNAAANQLTLGSFVARYLENIKDWENDSPAAVEYFDNLALACAPGGDLYARKAKTSDQFIQDTLKGIC